MTTLTQQLRHGLAHARSHAARWHDRVTATTARHTNRPLLDDATWRDARIIATTVIRGAPDADITGYLLELNSVTGRVKRQIAIPVGSTHALWNARGGNRGARGVCAYRNRLYVATATSILVYDTRLKPIDRLDHPHLAGLHEIAVSDAGIWITSTVHDLLVLLDFNGRAVHEWWGSESQTLQASLGFESRRLNLELDFARDGFAEGYDAYCKQERLHANSVCEHAGHVYTLLCRRRALVRFFPGPDQVVIHDPMLSAPHNCVFTNDGRVVINDTMNQAVRIYDLATGARLKTIRTEIDQAGRSEQFARSGWQRGLAHVRDSVFLVGTSPASVFELDIDSARIGRVLRIDDDVRHCIHGLTVEHNFGRVAPQVRPKVAA